MENPTAPIKYTVEARSQKDQSVIETLGEIEHGDLGLLFSALGISRERWVEYNASLRRPNPAPLINGLPAISRLAASDEGLLLFDPGETVDLKTELEKVESRMDSPAARNVVQKLQAACQFVQQVKGVLAIHPSGW